MKVIVPYRPDGGIRDRIWTYLRTQYWDALGFPVYVGDHQGVPFNRSKAINSVAGGRWDIAVIADSDTFVPLPQLVQAIDTAQSTRCAVSALTAVAELSRECTETMLNGTVSPLTFHIDTIRTKELETQSSVLVVPRTIWDHVGGFDERFQGWGGEDNAFWKAITLMQSEPKRVTGLAYHLWHPPAPDKHRGLNYKRNLALWGRYLNATTKAELP